MLALLACAELLGMALWFTGSSAGPALARAWNLTPAETGWLTTAVQLGFVAGTATSALLNVADVVPARLLFTVAALLGAAFNLPLGFTASFGVALASRFAAGFCLAGVYPPAMKMASTWFRARRGVAVGTIVGALTIGKALPYLAGAFPGVSVRTITMLASGSAGVAAMLVFSAYRDGPYEFPARPFSWARAGDVVRERKWRLATGGYLGHMAELCRRCMSSTPNLTRQTVIVS
ncbi:MAG: MFS transporter [Gemmatimonas sp.]